MILFNPLQLPPYVRRVCVSARMVGPLLQRDLRPGILRPAVPAGVSVPERRRLPQRERRMQLRSRLHGKNSSESIQFNHFIHLRDMIESGPGFLFFVE